jgi:predicted nucleotidyltransferase
VDDQQPSKEFIVALRHLEKWLDEAGAPHALLGGIAVSLIAEPRVTRGIDACVSAEQTSWPSLIDSGKPHGFAPRVDDAVAFAERSRVFLLVHEPTGIKVDLSVAGLPFEQEMLSHASTVKVGDFEVRIPSPEDLIITKAVAHRPRDLVDIASIVEIHPQLDLSRIRKVVTEFADALEMPEITEDLETVLKSYPR